MLIAVDIGNSTTIFGVFSGDDLIDRLVIPTTTDYAKSKPLSDFITSAVRSSKNTNSVVVSSVVPQKNASLSELIRSLLKTEPDFIDHSFDLGFTLNYEPANTIGSDRLANAAGAVGKYRLPVIVCSFGTATTIDAISSDAHFVGGTISPGIGMLAEALHLRTSKLPPISIDKKPESVFGNSTEDSIRSGIYFGYLGQVEGILARMLTTFTVRPTIVATGGFSNLLSKDIQMIDVVDQDLILDGIRILWKRGRRSA